MIEWNRWASLQFGEGVVMARRFTHAAARRRSGPRPAPGSRWSRTAGRAVLVAALLALPAVVTGETAAWAAPATTALETTAAGTVQPAPTCGSSVVVHLADNGSTVCVALGGS